MRIMERERVERHKEIKMRKQNRESKREKIARTIEIFNTSGPIWTMAYVYPEEICIAQRLHL